MIANLSKGGGFRGALDYLSRTGKDEPPGEIIGGNMAASDPRGLAKEFGASRALRPDVKKPVFHASLALPPGVSLSDQDWNKAAGKFLEEMGLGEDHQHIVIKHVDRDHEHVHVLASRINIRNGNLARERRADYKQAHGAAAAAAAAVGVEPVKPAPKHERKAALTRSELAHAEHAGQPHPKLQIAARLDAALAHSTTLDQFKAAALDHGVDVRFSSNAGGIYGVSYRLAGGSAGFAAAWFKGSQISKSHTLPSITRRLAGEIDTQRGPAGQRVRADILTNLTREKRGDADIVHWQNGTVAAMATDQEIRWRTGSAAESKVAAALAAERGWREIELADRGEAAKNQAAINAYLSQGIRVVNFDGKQYTPAANQRGNDRNDGRRETGRSGRDAAAIESVAAAAGATGRASGAAPTATAGAGEVGRDADEHRNAKADASANAAADAAASSEARRTASADLEDRPDRDPHGKTLDPIPGEEIMADALDFLNDETETPPPAAAPAAAPTTAPRPAAAAHKPTGPVPTSEDNSNALNAALAREMARRRWAPSAAVAVELEGRRQELEWHQMQSWSRRLMATARGQQALLRGECQRLQEAHRQALAREKGLRQYLKSDPISSSLINEEAQIAAKERAERIEEAASAAAAREAQAEAQREAALQREREALRQRESEKEDETPRPKKKSSGAPKPR